MVSYEDALAAAQKESDSKEFKRAQGLMLCILNDCLQKQIALERAKNEYDKIASQLNIAEERLKRLQQHDWSVLIDIEEDKKHNE